MIRSILRIALVACLAVLLPVSPSLHAQSAPALAKKLAKLEKQFVKQQATLDKAQDTLAALAAQALVADDQLAAVAAMPVGTPAEQKAAAKALKKAQKLVGKLANSQLKGTAKEAKAQQKLDGLADQIELLDPGHFDDTTTGDGGDGGDGEDGSGDGGDDPGTGDPGSG
ncbi:MAG TPA: hypothetical protein VK824_11125, partial [Planctomycetota bacterium]|nr:hypothetical protein [Planctomycetota bacterium]